MSNTRQLRIDNAIVREAKKIIREAEARKARQLKENEQFRTFKK